MKRNLHLVFVAALLAWMHAASAQSFSSGSTGADGALNIPNFSGTTTITVRPGGVYNYTTVTIGNSATLRFNRGNDNSPVVILASGDVNITSGASIDISGSAGPSSDGTQPAPGGLGGPGGFNGGRSFFNPTIPLAAAGQGPAGGAGFTSGVNNGGAGGGFGGPNNFVGLIPLFGGSGGGGAGTGGGGGGGAILIASSTRIIIDGQIRSNGGTANFNFNCPNTAGGGAGGAIRLVAPEIRGAGSMQALPGAGSGSGCGQPNATTGRIRLEAFTLSGFTGSASPVASVVNSPGPVSAGGNPQLSNVPTLAITSIGGTAVPATPLASYSAPDIALAPGTANPIAVQLAATNTPVGSPTVISVRLMPLGSLSSVAVASADHTGTFASSTASANVTLPVGQVTVIQASAAMTLTGQTASLFPLIDGEPVERVMVAAAPGQPSSLSLVSRSGKEVRVDELSAQDQAKVALAWEAMKATQ